MPCSNTTHPGHVPRRPQCTPPHESHPLTSKTVASRGVPPRRAVRARNAADTDTRTPKCLDCARSTGALEPGGYGAVSEGREYKPGEAPSCGGWGREGARSEVRAEQRLAPGGRAALPLTPTS